jgi:hypothetical protein
MRLASAHKFGVCKLAVSLAALASLGACGDPDAAKINPLVGNLEGDQTLIASAQTISDAIGGCTKPADAQIESKVVGMQNGAIVMLACSQGSYSTTHRLFAVHTADGLELLTIPDYDAGGWFATDQASMAEIDAGNETLTTFRKSADDGRCGSEGTYHWDGKKFTVQELRSQDCTAPDRKGPPFPVVWPTQVGAVVDPNGATPEP